ncbi:MAG: exosortase F system-associated protein [Aureibaculum sp.]|nr:exosortase F system-associated protein [Aureibaculum sp.]
MNRWVRLGIIGVLIVLLMLVRAYGTELFYDPFIAYFKHDYLNSTIPGFNSIKLFFNLFVRYAMNAIISLAIIYAAFQKRELVIFSIKFYVLAFIVLSIVYYLLLRAGMANGYLFTFYVRRFLTHPIFILVLLPAFYYQQKILSKNK